MTVSKPMTGEQLDELMTVAVNMQRDSEKAGDRPSSMFAYAVQVAVLELRKVRNEAAALAAENAGLLPKAASELSNAWVLHKYLIGIQAAIMYLDNGNKKAAQEWLYGTIAGPGFEFPDAVDDIDAWATHQMRGSVNHQQALEIIKAETPATDAFLAEVRAQHGESICASLLEKASEYDARAKEVNCHITDNRYRFAAAMFRGFAAQLRKGVQS